MSSCTVEPTCPPTPTLQITHDAAPEVSDWPETVDAPAGRLDAPVPDAQGSSRRLRATLLPLNLSTKALILFPQCLHQRQQLN